MLSLSFLIGTCNKFQFLCSLYIYKLETSYPVQFRSGQMYIYFLFWRHTFLSPCVLNMICSCDIHACCPGYKCPYIHFSILLLDVYSTVCMYVHVGFSEGQSPPQYAVAGQCWSHCVHVCHYNGLPSAIPLCLQTHLA